jgi:hypothetical protein
MCAVASASGQSIRTLGYNTTNGEVVYSGTNALTFTNGLGFAGSAAGATRTNLGLGTTNAVTIQSMTAQTYTVTAGGGIVLQAVLTNAASFRTNIGLGWDGLTNTNASGFRSALELSAGWLTNSNVTNFRTAIGLGSNDVVTFNDTTVFSLAVQDVTPISIAGDGLSFNDTNSTNIANGKAGWRDSLGLPLPALTNTSNDNFRSAIGLPWSGLTNTNRNTFRIALELEGTNAIPVQRAYELYDGANEAVALSAGDGDLVAGPYLIITNAPTNTTNAVRWIQVIQGTNFYKLPLYQ